MYLIEDYEKQYGRESGNNFAAASYENHILEIVEALCEEPERSDLTEWNINAKEYYDALKAALYEKISDNESEYY